MLYIYFYIYLFLHLFISVFLCPYVNEVGGPNLSQQPDWLQECARFGSTSSALLTELIRVQECCWLMAHPAAGASCTLTFRCMKREVTVETCGASRQLHGWRPHVSTAIVTMATLRGDAGKLLIMSKTMSHQSDVHVRDTLMNN